MLTEVQLIDALREPAPDAIDPVALSHGVMDGVRAAQRRRVVLAAVAAVAAVSVTAVVVSRVVGADASPQPPAATQGEHVFGHTDLPAEVFDLRGEAVLDALDFQHVQSPGRGVAFEDCDAPDASVTNETKTPDGRRDAVCVATGNVPDNWLVLQLFLDGRGPNQGQFMEVWFGIEPEPDSSLPLPPPVAVRLVQERMADVASEFGEDSFEYRDMMHVYPMFQSMAHLDEWDAAGWDDDYWGIRAVVAD